MASEPPPTQCLSEGIELSASATDETCSPTDPMSGAAAGTATATATCGSTAQADIKVSSPFLTSYLRILNSSDELVYVSDPISGGSVDLPPGEYFYDAYNFCHGPECRLDITISVGGETVAEFRVWEFEPGFGTFVVSGVSGGSCTFSWTDSDDSPAGDGTAITGLSAGEYTVT